MYSNQIHSLVKYSFPSIPCHSSRCTTTVNVWWDRACYMLNVTAVTNQVYSYSWRADWQNTHSNANLLCFWMQVILSWKCWVTGVETSLKLKLQHVNKALLAWRVKKYNVSRDFMYPHRAGVGNQMSLFLARICLVLNLSIYILFLAFQYNNMVCIPFTKDGLIWSIWWFAWMFSFITTIQ